MSQHRELLPRTVYLPPEAIDEADGRADELSIATATLLRMILLGRAEPLVLAEPAGHGRS